VLTICRIGFILLLFIHFLLCIINILHVLNKNPNLAAVEILKIMIFDVAAFPLIKSANSHSAVVISTLVEVMFYLLLVWFFTSLFAASVVYWQNRSIVFALTLFLHIASNST
jgi:hypothetical protein